MYRRNTTCTMIIHVRTAHHRCQAQCVAQDTKQKHGTHFFSFYFCLSFPFFFFLFLVIRFQVRKSTSPVSILLCFQLPFVRVSYTWSQCAHISCIRVGSQPLSDILRETKSHHLGVFFCSFFLWVCFLFFVGFVGFFLFCVFFLFFVVFFLFCGVFFFDVFLVFVLFFLCWCFFPFWVSGRTLDEVVFGTLPVCGGLSHPCCRHGDVPSAANLNLYEGSRSHVHVLIGGSGLTLFLPLLSCNVILERPLVDLG